MKKWLGKEVQDFGLYIIPLIFILGFLFIKLLPLVLYSQIPIQPDFLTGVYDTRHIEGTYYGHSVTSKNFDTSTLAYNVLGSSSEPKRIEIDLSKQRLYAFEGNTKVYDCLISAGRMDTTPTGAFHIWAKMRYSNLEGGNDFFGTYYKLPNAPFVLYFTNDAYQPELGLSIHGSYWQQNFGHPVTNGGIDMSISDAEKLYYWANPPVEDTPLTRITIKNPGTPIIIYGDTPST